MHRRSRPCAPGCGTTSWITAGALLPAAAVEHVAQHHRAGADEQRRAEHRLDVRLGRLGCRPSGAAGRRRGTPSAPSRAPSSRTSLRLTVPLRRCTAAPNGRITTAATRSLEIAADGLTPNSRISIGVISAPPPAPGHPDQEADDGAAQHDVRIDVHARPPLASVPRPEPPGAGSSSGSGDPWPSPRAARMVRTMRGYPACGIFAEIPFHGLALGIGRVYDAQPERDHGISTFVGVGVVDYSRGPDSEQGGGEAR